jgi:hypothetical protein
MARDLVDFFVRGPSQQTNPIEKSFLIELVDALSQFIVLVLLNPNLP